jgi:hypothetical protein
MKFALQEAFADTTLNRFDPTFANLVMIGLVRLLDYFGSPQANRSLLTKIRRGEFSKATLYLLERVAGVGARQERTLRNEFERALRAIDAPTLWTPELAIPFVEAEIEEKPEAWMDVALDRLDDIESLDSVGQNALALILGGLCNGGMEDSVLTGLASGDPTIHAPVLSFLFGRGSPKAELTFDDDVSRVDLMDRNYSACLVLDLFETTFVVSEFLERRLRDDVPETLEVQSDMRRFEDISHWVSRLKQSTGYYQSTEPVAA